MTNLIGEDIDQRPQLLESSQVAYHSYGKAETRQGRKMGHFNTISPRSRD
jgi:5-(carboxyamino)imidazole ribonucleotide synthase